MVMARIPAMGPRVLCASAAVIAEWYGQWASMRNCGGPGGRRKTSSDRRADFERVLKRVFINLEMYFSPPLTTLVLLLY